MACVQVNTRHEVALSRYRDHYQRRSPECSGFVVTYPRSPLMMASFDQPATSSASSSYRRSSSGSSRTVREPQSERRRSAPLSARPMSARQLSTRPLSSDGFTTEHLPIEVPKIQTLLQRPRTVPSKLPTPELHGQTGVSEDWQHHSRLRRGWRTPTPTQITSWPDGAQSPEPEALEPCIRRVQLLAEAIEEKPDMAGQSLPAQELIRLAPSQEQASHPRRALDDDVREVMEWIRARVHSGAVVTGAALLDWLLQSGVEIQLASKAIRELMLKGELVVPSLQPAPGSCSSTSRRRSKMALRHAEAFRARLWEGCKPEAWSRLP